MVIVAKREFGALTKGRALTVESLESHVEAPASASARSKWSTSNVHNESDGAEADDLSAFIDEAANHVLAGPVFLHEREFELWMLGPRGVRVKRPFGNRIGMEVGRLLLASNERELLEVIARTVYPNKNGIAIDFDRDAIAAQLSMSDHNSDNKAQADA